MPIPWRNKENLFLTYDIYVFQKYLHWRRILRTTLVDILSVTWPVVTLARWNTGFFSEVKWKFTHTKFFFFLLSFLISYLIKGTATSCLLLLSGIMETHRAINIDGLDLQAFGLSVRQIIWTRYRVLMGFASPNKQYVITRLFTFTSSEIIPMMQLRKWKVLYRIIFPKLPKRSTVVDYF